MDDDGEGVSGKDVGDDRVNVVRLRASNFPSGFYEEPGSPGEDAVDKDRHERLTCARRP